MLWEPQVMLWEPRVLRRGIAVTLCGRELETVNLRCAQVIRSGLAGPPTLCVSVCLATADPFGKCQRPSTPSQHCGPPNAHVRRETSLVYSSSGQLELNDDQQEPYTT
jgi:hypothetical protein